MLTFADLLPDWDLENWRYSDADESNHRTVRAVNV